MVAKEGLFYLICLWSRSLKSVKKSWNFNIFGMRRPRNKKRWIRPWRCSNLFELFSAFQMCSICVQWN